jgi:hypothetical protein
MTSLFFFFPSPQFPNHMDGKTRGKNEKNEPATLKTVHWVQKWIRLLIEQSYNLPRKLALHMCFSFLKN